MTKIAAVAEDGEPCVTYIGADGAGHYVKMVHNGIEYGDMQLIAEAYSLLKGGLNLSNEELAQTFTGGAMRRYRSKSKAFMCVVNGRAAAPPCRVW